jgi:biotin carboxyl carrier protein
MPARSQGEKPGPSHADQAAQNLRDHQAIGRLADDLLPALIAKLAASGLGEIEVRQGEWKARLRKPAVAAEPRAARTATDNFGHAPARSSGHGRTDAAHSASGDSGSEPGAVTANSPAVGVFNPRRDLVVGMRVRSGDKIGTVDVLGVNQDVIAPVEGVIGSSLVEAGEAVEYGQQLVRIELPEAAPTVAAPAATGKA